MTITNHLGRIFYCINTIYLTKYVDIRIFGGVIVS